MPHMEAEYEEYQYLMHPRKSAVVQYVMFSHLSEVENIQLISVVCFAHKMVLTAE